MGPGESATFEFGPFRLDPAERRLLRDGASVPLTPKAFDLLVYLVERHNHLVEKSELMSALWPDTVVEDANLAFNVSALRKALGDGHEDAKFIETVPTRGYRFVARVIETRAGGALQEPGSRRWQLTAVAIVGLTALATAVLWTTGLVRRSEEGVPRAVVLRRLTASPAELPVLSAAISPDGKYLAYADRTGIKVQIIDS
jgi:DNA-binding winged helix-turn-helix (wHTH) protein